MNLFGMVRNVIGAGNDIDEYDDYEYDDRDSSEYRRVAQEQSEERSRRLSSLSNYQGQQAPGKIVPMHTEINDMKVVVLTPRNYDDARAVCDKLKAWAPCIVKLDRLEKDEAQRVVDFIMGACYTMDGHVQEIKEDVFLVTPSMVDIEKEFDEIKSIKSSNSFFSKFSVK